MTPQDFNNLIALPDIPRRVAPLNELTLADMPPRLGLFVLPGAVLLPGGRLPLQVFEPRYIALLENALAQHRLIGIIQPLDDDEDDALLDNPPLHKVGAVGRIVEFAEQIDGTFMIVLHGVARFRLLQDKPTDHGWREGAIDVSGYVEDMMDTSAMPVGREALLNTLKDYLAARDLRTDWTLLDELDDEALLIVLPMLIPFEDEEKQLLLEAQHPKDRAELLLTLLRQGME
ncbi:Lon-like ATP-dependent protease La [Neokomagataea thailandica NBRC 106555]|uniref:Peptidase n=2 Tax=Neokomagataea TaxID=1223423 RepID=A0A4Y6V4P4_9PROT|nr:MULTISPECIES: LON peptidase substrate-binding domain-containing protein [Neokomagataea]QDH24893.1 peptidase [Neokomagataea tanensis]GBR54100.1 Lon-like ATP-dependent protease La [Neokomagataea thailandica NBRC 106555]